MNDKRMSNRIKNAVKVVFSADYKIGGTTYYRKDETHFMHKKAAEALKKNGAKFKADDVDVEKEKATLKGNNQLNKK